jgi:capsular polysaccharide biosynthesis protein
MDVMYEVTHTYKQTIGGPVIMEAVSNEVTGTTTPEEK